MNPLLFEPMAAKASHALLSTQLNPLTAGAGPSEAALSSNSPVSSQADFQRQLAVLQAQGGVSAQGLVGLKTADLQKEIAGMSPDQKISVAQQLMGSTVSVQNGGGQITQGAASKLEIKNGQPVFDVAGQKYSLGQLVSVIKTPS